MSSEGSSRDNSPAAEDQVHIEHQPNGTAGAHDAAQADAVDTVAQDGDELDTSFFPAPAHYYKRYTDYNLSIQDKDAAIDAPQGGTDARVLRRRDLDPPDVDEIVRHGSYSVFGETWPVEEQLPSLAHMGVREMFDKGQDRSQSLSTLLRAMLVTYTQLVSSLLQPPPSLEATEQYMAQNQGQEPQTDSERLVEHIRLISVNMHHLVNELRPVQARETLKSMMRQQIERRRAKTAAINQRCAELYDILTGLRGQNEPQKSQAARSTAEIHKQDLNDDAWNRLVKMADLAAAAAEAADTDMSANV
ncbi:hypothetical protein OIV83_004672 [Microbotryomycetes sp. JL201]|nr:hypothetical protein OIV83_004672 [Microbotryomycetes sp. JL201]